MAMYAVNAKRLGASEYTGLTLLKVFEYDGELYGLTSTGLLHFTGTTDSAAAIVSRVRTGFMDFGSSTFKNIPAVYLGGTHPTKMRVKATTTEESLDKERSYPLTRITGEHQASRAKLGRGVKSKRWMIELTNPCGKNTKLDRCDAQVDAHRRRV